MKPAKRLLKRAIASPAGWRLSAPLQRHRLIVLAYHRIGRQGDPFKHVDAAEFTRQMQWLRRHCDVVHPAKIRSALHPSRSRPAVVITFDDAYRDYFELARPALRECGFTAATFVATAFIDHGGMFWWDRVHLSVHRTRRERLMLPWEPFTVFQTTDAAGRHTYRMACTLRIAEAPPEEQDALVRQVFDATGVDTDALGLPRQVMTWDEIRASMDVTCYGGHTHTHVRIPRTDPEAIDGEVRLCRERLESETGVRPTLFAYPTGDTTTHAQQVLRRHGFEVAFSLKEEMYVPPDVDWLDVPRFPGPFTVEDLAWIAFGRAARR